MNTAGLRAELGGSRIPDFEITPPPGWTRQAVDDVTLERVLDGLRRRLMEAHEPQKFVEMRALVMESFKAMERDGAFAFFSATKQRDDTLWMPASIIAAERRAETGQTLDDLARSLIQEFGATPLRGDPRIMRFERSRPVRFGNETLISNSIVYLTPIPGAGRRRALQLVAGFATAPDMPDDHPTSVELKHLFDTCVSTLRWRHQSEKAN